MGSKHYQQHSTGSAVGGHSTGKNTQCTIRKSMRIILRTSPQIFVRKYCVNFRLLNFCLLLLCKYNQSGANSFDLDQTRRLVGPDLGPNCLQMLPADSASRSGV